MKKVYEWIIKNQSAINKIFKITGIIVGILLAIGILIRIFINDPAYYKDSKKEFKQSQVIIDSILKSQKELNSQLEDLKVGQIMLYNTLDNNSKLIEKYNKNLETFRRTINEQIKNVDRYSINDLDSFFRTKYRQYYQ